MSEGWSTALTYVTGVLLVLSSASLGVRYKLSSHSKFPNYPRGTPRDRALMATYAIVLALVGVYRINTSTAPGGFRVDLAGGLGSLMLAAYHCNQCYEMLRSRLPPVVWRRVERAKRLARCQGGFRWRQLVNRILGLGLPEATSAATAVAALSLAGEVAAAPFELPDDNPDLIDEQTRRLLALVP